MLLCLGFLNCKMEQSFVVSLLSMPGHAPFPQTVLNFVELPKYVTRSYSVSQCLLRPLVGTWSISVNK